MQPKDRVLQQREISWLEIMENQAPPLVMEMKFPLPITPYSLPVTQKGRVLTVLSIDGGGIRGLIPATILARLEDHLQVCKEFSARSSARVRTRTHI